MALLGPVNPNPQPWNPQQQGGSPQWMQGLLGPGQGFKGMTQSPLLMAGLGLLSASRDDRQDPYQAALGGLLTAQQQQAAAKQNALRNQYLQARTSDIQAKEEAAKHQQQVLRQVADADASQIPSLLIGSGDPRLAITGINALLNQQSASRNTVQGSPIKLKNGNFGYLDKAGKVVDTGKPFYSPINKFNVGGVTYGINPENNQITALVSPKDIAETAANIEAKKKEAKIRAEATAKKEIQAPAAYQAYQQTTASVDNVIDTAKKALGQINWRTAGPIGTVASQIPGTTSYDIEKLIDTIKANIGFDRLQQMRESSPTGGALGQVSERELEFLQSAVSSLDISQSPEQLRANIEKVIQHYNNWKDIADEKYKTEYGDASNGEPSNVTNWSDM